MITHVVTCSAALSLLAVTGCASRDVPASDDATDVVHAQGVFPTPYGPLRLGYDFVDGLKLHQGGVEPPPLPGGPRGTRQLGDRRDFGPYDVVPL